MCFGWRRCGRQDITSNFVHKQPAAGRVHADRVRQDHAQDECEQEEFDRARSVGHSRPGGLRSPASSMLSANKQHPLVLFDRQPELIAQRAQQVARRAQAQL